MKKKNITFKINFRVFMHLTFVDYKLHTHTARAINPGRPQGSLSPGILCSCHHLHGLGDLLDVLDGLQPQSDWLQNETLVRNVCIYKDIKVYLL